MVAVKYYASCVKDGRAVQEVCDEFRVGELVDSLRGSRSVIASLRVYPEIRIYDTVFCLSELSVGIVVALGLDSILVALESGKRCIVGCADFINLSNPLDSPMTLFISFQKCSAKAVEAFRILRETGRIVSGYESLDDLSEKVLAWIEDSLRKGSKHFVFQKLEQLKSSVEMLSSKFFADLGIVIWYGYSVSRGTKVLNLDTFKEEEWNGRLNRFIPVVRVPEGSDSDFVDGSSARESTVDYFLS